MTSTIIGPGAPSGQLPDAETSWTSLVPDGAIAMAAEGPSLVLRASERLQQRFEELLAARKAGTITEQQNRQYEAICRLDETLTWLNRQVRGLRRP